MVVRCFYAAMEAARQTPSIGPVNCLRAFANDVDPHLVFAQLVWGLGNRGDLLVGLSTSGNARNVCAAMEAAKARGLVRVGLSGKTGGRMSSHCDLCIRAPASETYLIQEFHLPIYHCLCLMLEDEFFGGADSLNDLTGFPFQGRRDETQPSSQPVK